jgi:predicted patatin/cPLA2 family phospholipase
VLVGKHVFDLRALYRVLYPGEFGLDVAAVRRAPFPVVVTLTDADTGETLHPDIRKVDDPLAWIHAGAALPLAAEAPIEIDGRRFLDGGTTDPIPLQRAIDDGHRDIICVLNRPRGERKPEPAWATRLFGRSFPGLRRHAEAHHAYHNAATRLAESPPPGVRVRVVRPQRDTGLSRTTRDVKKLQAAIAQGRADAARALPDLAASPSA